MELHSDNSTGAVNADRTLIDRTVDNPAEILLEIPELKTPLARGTMRGGLAVLKLVSAEYDVSIGDLRGKDRHRTIAEARQLACWLLRQTRRFSFPEIGIILSRDHSTVMHSVARIEERLKIDPHLRAAAERILAELEPGPRIEGFESGRFG